jgi:hypothetical protein
MNARAASTAQTIAAPPPRGTTVACEDRSLGRSSNPTFRARARNAGVNTTAMAKAMAAAKDIAVQDSFINAQSYGRFASTSAVRTHVGPSGAMLTIRGGSSGPSRLKSTRTTGTTTP